MYLAEKYRAERFSDIIGQDDAIKEVKLFMKNFPKRKALLIYGPPGTGKTSLALILAKENNLEVLELNSSDLRNRLQLEKTLRPASEQKSLFANGKLLLMDEVDGVTGTDIGGIPELVKLIHSTPYPIVMTCNDAWQSKLSPIRAKSKLVEVKPLSIGNIVSFLYRICENEGINKSTEFLKKLAIKSQGDLRAAVNDLEAHIHYEEASVDTNEKRDVEENIFNILRRLFKEREDFLNLFDSTNFSLDEILLWIEENAPREYRDIALAKAMFALSNADVFRGRIYRQQAYRFLVYQNIFQSAGISYAKQKSSPGFTKYERPKRILKIWLNNQKIAKKKSISQKYARFVHCSTARALRDFAMLAPIIKQEDVQKKLKLSDEEIAYLNSIK